MNIETSLIYLEKNKEFYIRCEDKYNTLNSFIQHYKDLSHEIDNNSKHIVTIKDKVESYYKAKDYVHSYNKELKDKYIKLLDEQKQKINEAYERNLKCNEDLLSFITILINSYINTQNEITFSNLTNNSKFNIDKINSYLLNDTSNENITNLLYYFNNEHILLNPTVNLKCHSTLHSINYQCEQINAALLLSDGRLVLAFHKRTIKIINLSTFAIEIEINDAGKGFIYSVVEYKPSHIATCSFDNYLRFYSLSKNSFTQIGEAKPHLSSTIKLAVLPNSRVATASWDKSVAITSTIEPFSKVAQIREHKDTVTSIMYLKEKNQLVSASWDKQLIFMNGDSYTVENKISNVYCSWINCLCEIDSETLMVAGNKEIFIVNHNTYQVMSVIHDKNFVRILSLGVLRDGSIICGANNTVTHFTKEKYIKDYQEKRNCDTFMILPIGERIILFGSARSVLDVWKY